MKKKNVKNITLAVLAAAALATPNLQVFADVSAVPPAIQSVTIQKLQFVDLEGTLPSVQNTGTTMDLSAFTGAETYDKSEHGDVGFTIYSIDESLLEGADESTVATAIQAAVNGGTALPYGAAPVGSEVMVDDNGQVVFPDLPGIDQAYVVVETTRPATVALQAYPIFFMLPITNPDGDGYLDTVTFYPKNAVDSVEVSLIKNVHRNDTAVPVVYPGATFNLYEGTPGNGTLVPDSAQVTGTDGSLTVTGLTAGSSYYFVEDSVATEDVTADGVHNNVLIKPEFTNSEDNLLTFTYQSDGSVIYPEGSLLAEGASVINYETPSIEKEIVTPENDGSYFVGQTINYQVTLPTPHDVTSYTNLTYTDTPAAGITLDASTIAVTVGGTVLDASNYVVSTTGDNVPVGGYVISFTPSALTDGEDVVVTYEAIINDQAVIGDAQENIVDLNFNNGYETGADEDNAEVITYGHEFLKQGRGLFGTELLSPTLEGAEFVIKNGDSEYLVVAENARTWTTVKEDATTFTSDAEGKIRVTGLDLGDYVIEETKAPANYNLPSNPNTTFTVAAHEADTPLVTTITNVQNPDLPVTGLYYTDVVAGSLAVLGGLGTLLAVKRKKRDDE